MRIRRAEPRDVETILPLIHELAQFEESVHFVEATSDQLRESFFGPEPRVFCDLLESDDAHVAAFVVWFLNYSTWTGTHGIYLEDLFVRPHFRGRGYGRDLLVHLARECVTHGCQRFQWSVLDWNQGATDLYEFLGAQAVTEWTGYRMTEPAISRLATFES